MRKIRHNISDFMRKEIFLLSIIFLTLINPFFNGYRIAIIFVCFLLFKLRFTLISIDKTLLYLLCFTFSYEILASTGNEAEVKPILLILINILMPVILYLVGKYVSFCYSSSHIRAFFLFFISFSFSLIPLISIFTQIAQYGFLEGTRSMYLLWDKTTEFTATGLAAYFVLNMAAIGLVVTKRNSEVEKKIGYSIVILFILSLICTLRLGSRTQIGISLVAIATAYFVGAPKHSRMANFLIFIFCISIIVIIWNSLDMFSNAFYFYEDRINDADAGINSFGGRTERWTGAVKAIFTDPFGWELSRFGYAHNLWLDVARVAGIIPLSFLVLYTALAIKSMIKGVKLLKGVKFLQMYLILFFCCIFIIFNLEPIMEGSYLLFLIFSILTGFISGIIAHNKFLQMSLANTDNTIKIEEAIYKG